MSLLRPALGPWAFPVATALGCGLLERPIDTENPVMVLVSARGLYPGVVIEEEDLFAVEIPPQLLPNGVPLSPDSVGPGLRVTVRADDDVTVQPETRRSP